jgi:hypothetical protein
MDSEDSFATQISKLPPPILTQTGTGVQDAGATYNPTDIYKQLENERKNHQPAQQMQMQQQNFPETPVNHGNNYYTQPSQMPQPPPQYYAGPAQPTTVAPPPSISEGTFERKKKKKRAAAWSFDIIKKKQPWIIAAIMFLVIVYGLPRLRTISALINPVSGQMSTPAIAAACIASGLLASIASDFV